MAFAYFSESKLSWPSFLLTEKSLKEGIYGMKPYLNQIRMFRNREHQQKLCNFIANPDNFFCLFLQSSHQLFPLRRTVEQLNTEVGVLYMPRLLYCRSTARDTTWEDAWLWSTWSCCQQQVRRMEPWHSQWVLAPPFRVRQTPGMNLLFLTCCALASLWLPFISFREASPVFYIKCKVSLSVIFIF